MVKVSFYTDFYFYFRFQTNYSCCCLPLNLRSTQLWNFSLHEKVFFQICNLLLIDFPDKLDLWHSIILFSASIPICHWSMFGFLDRPEPWPSINLFVRFLPPIQQPPSISSLFIWPRYNWGAIYGYACHWLNPCCWKFIDEDTNSNWHNNYSTMTYIYNFKLMGLVVPVHCSVRQSSISNLVLSTPAPLTTQKPTSPHFPPTAYANSNSCLGRCLCGRGLSKTRPLHWW